MLGFGGEFRMREEAERIEAVVERHDHDAARREARSVVARLRTRADDEAAPVNPDHDRKLLRIVRFDRRPDVKSEAVLRYA